MQIVETRDLIWSLHRDYIVRLRIERSASLPQTRAHTAIRLTMHKLKMTYHKVRMKHIIQ